MSTTICSFLRPERCACHAPAGRQASLGSVHTERTAPLSMPSKGGKTGVGAGSSSGAWQLDDADDPADWTDAFAFLREMDASLRCELCYVCVVVNSGRMW